MRGLSLWQPWASMIALGEKRVETRSWAAPTHVHGTEIAIQSTQRFPREAQAVAMTNPAVRRTIEMHSLWKRAEAFPRGVIVAVVTLVRCRPVEAVVRDLSDTERALGDYTPGRFAWELMHVRALPEPVVCRGAQGLWRVPADVEVVVRTQLHQLTRRTG